MSPPPGALSIAGWALLPLRAFLGVTFCFAGLQKLANPNFFNANNPSGIQAQLIASERISPLHSLLGHLLHLATPVGLLIALGELAVGLGTILGLWTRIAAVGGALLSFTLFLTVSFHSSPYYTGADIVFLFAWTPLILAGSGGVLSLDVVIASWARQKAMMGSPVPVPVQFSAIQGICGSFEDDQCRARDGAPCEVRGCPFLVGLDPDRSRRLVTDVERRAIVLGGAAVGVTAVVGLVAAGLAAGLGRLVGGAKPSSAAGTATLPGPSTSAAGSTTTSTSAAAPAGGTSPATTGTTGSTPSGSAIGPASDVPVGGAARFTDPASGDPGLVLQLTEGSFVAYDAICPHAGCTVGYSTAAKLIVCPCHGSEFNPDTGAVEVGPATRGLGTIHVAEGSDGQLYVDG
jgi:thiosulfate dehydrogenase (quinone) large subunit